MSGFIVIPAGAQLRAGIVCDQVGLLRHTIPARACGASGMTARGMEGTP